MSPGKSILAVLALAVAAVGCRSGRAPRVVDSPPPPPVVALSPTVELAAYKQTAAEAPSDEAPEALRLPPIAQPDPAGEPGPTAEPEPIAAPETLPNPAARPLELGQVISSVRSSFPLIQQAAAGRVIASGETLSASGAFDHKLDADSVSQPLDFYKNYRNGIGVKRDTTWGGQTFAGYRIGRGEFEPWYLERETNKGGEFKLGFMAPIGRDRWIDENRSALWQAQLEQRRVEPEILAQVIFSVREGSVAYWGWVAAGANYRIAEGLLQLAEERNQGLEAQVEAQEKAPIDLVDNRRIIVSREAKQIDARRKLEQSAVKLSLYYRAADGAPLVADDALLPAAFPEVPRVDPGNDPLPLTPGDTELALRQRPELVELQTVRQQLNVALRQANNETWPDLDAGLISSQDVGEPTSSKRDKSQLKLEAVVTMSVPLERRKALGKIRSLQGKLAQVAAKNRYASDKIVAEVQVARAALKAASERVVRATESFELAGKMQQAERELFSNGQSTLFNLNIREQQAAEAAADRVDALLEYYIARADYAAALGEDAPAL
ncbi:Outer membrane efflux protein [Pirellulimonas nuda]|uniref:Outer membrane efflux protein n=1 Tax=Pirellulimonas nuda TaxID=2528009 RepID=A0A518DE16_9BACT|nr:TolC family protein [Pirellulimonas nuda]QDU89728.1 Outer membrane efflux protein [Pirellulimonas nuda]